MLQKYYVQFCDEVKPVLQLYQTMFDTMEIEQDIQSLCDFQNQLIQFGTELEKKYHIEETPFMKSLETLAECFYEMTLPDADYERITHCAKRLLEKLEDNISESISVNDIDLSLVLIIKNEAEYIEEWLEFHKMLGVGHFYVYDNESTDCLMEILQPYIEEESVTYHFFPGEDIQIDAYNHALFNYKYDTKYMGFIDTDEFLFPIVGESLPETVQQIFDDYHKKEHRVDYAGGIGVNWRVYGPGYHKEKPHGLVIENYKYRGTDKYEMNELIKVICNPVVVERFQANPHNVRYGSDRIVTISENGSTIPRAFFYDSKCEKIRINHYYTRSEDEYKTKVFQRGWTGMSEEAIRRVKDNFKTRLTECYDVEDYIMERFVAQLKERMEKLK